MALKQTGCLSPQVNSQAQQSPFTQAAVTASYPLKASQSETDTARSPTFLSAPSCNLLSLESRIAFPWPINQVKLTKRDVNS